MLSQSPSAELKRRLLALNESWPPLLAAVKERHEKLERAKKALDELIDTERDTKEEIGILGAELGAVKISEKVRILTFYGIHCKFRKTSKKCPRWSPFSNAFTHLDHVWTALFRSWTSWKG